MHLEDENCLRETRVEQFIAKYGWADFYFLYVIFTL